MPIKITIQNEVGTIAVLGAIDPSSVTVHAAMDQYLIDNPSYGNIVLFYAEVA